jgi:putative ABC transport system permease protein
MIRFILADLRRLWAGSLVVVLLVALATALGVSVILQERALRLGSARAADKFDLVIGAGGSETQLVLSSIFLQPSPLPLMPGDILAKLAADPRVAWLSPVGFGDSFSGYPVVGTSTALPSDLSGGFSEGRGFAAETEAVVGAAVPLPLGTEIKPMHGTIETGGHTHTEIVYRVSGRMKPTGTAWDRAILVPIEAVWHIHGMETHEEAGHEAHDHEPESGHELSGAWPSEAPGIPAILVKPKTIADAYKLRQDYRNGSTVAVFPGEVLTNLYATLGDAKRILVAVASGAQGLVAASLILVTVIHISQRRRQIGALRAFGAPRQAIFGIVWGEFFLLIATGIAAGFALGYGAALMLSGLFSANSGIAVPVGFARQDAVLAILLLGFGAVLAALPAILAYRQPPARALRA